MAGEIIINRTSNRGNVDETEHASSGGGKKNENLPMIVKVVKRRAQLGD